MAKNKGKKKNNPYGGKKGKKKNNPYGGKKGSLKVNPANYQSKPQKQAFIKSIISDGKITPVEAKNANTLGINEGRIRRSYDDQFRPGNVYSNTPKIIGGQGPSQIGGSVQSTPYSPLRMGGEATALLAPMVEPDRSAQTPVAQNPVNQNPVVLPPEPPEEPPYDPFADFMTNAFPSILEALTPQPYEPLPPPTTYASIGQAAQSAPGVKARRSSASLSQQSSLGTRGSFNRGGLRISNLNI